jgi:DNA-binding transcriptional ArsR family regulator
MLDVHCAARNAHRSLQRFLEKPTKALHFLLVDAQSELAGALSIPSSAPAAKAAATPLPKRVPPKRGTKTVRTQILDALICGGTPVTRALLREKVTASESTLLRKLYLMVRRGEVRASASVAAPNTRYSLPPLPLKAAKPPTSGIADRILEHIGEDTGWRSVANIALELGESRANVQGAMRRLLAKGLVERCTSRPLRYRIAQGTEEREPPRGNGRRA